MFRSARWVLGQRRYQALAVAAVVIALLCGVAGTWQVNQFNASVRDNNALRANAHAATTPLTTRLVPLAGTSSAPGRNAIRYRTVTVTGTYLAAQQTYLTDQSSADTSGFWVLTPLRTADGVVIVARGFVSDRGRLVPPADIARPPAGTVRVTGRLETADTTADDAAGLGHAMVNTVNPADQAARLSAPVYDAYLELLPDQPGTAGLTALPAPDLTNPAGGAYEWQHFAYILQWYLFALLALAMPFVFARHEVHEARKQYLGIDPGAEQYDADELPGVALPELPAGSAPAPAGASGTVAVRDSGGALARGYGITPEQWRQAQVLADRYGRSLGPERPDRAVTAGARPHRLRRPDPADPITVLGGPRQPHRSEGDRFHGAYNDYLWELALADGDMPDVLLSPGGPVDPRTGDPADAGEQPPQCPTTEPRYVRDDQPGAD